MPTQTLSMTTSIPRLALCPRSTPPTAPYVATSRRSLLAVGSSIGSEGYSSRAISSGKHSQAILGPLGVIQDMCLDDTDKGREAFSKVKALLRRAKARVLETLFEATEDALGAVSAEDARGYFRHCGYTIPQAHSI